MHDLPPAADIRGRIAAFFGDELADDLIEIHSESDGVTLSGYVANPMHSRATGRMQYLFLNGRAIRDRALQHALGEAYRGLLLTGRQPICFLRLDMPAEMVDVNVHPTKQEVRFQDSGRLYSQLLGTLRTKFLTTDLTARGSIAAAARLAVRERRRNRATSRRERIGRMGEAAIGQADCASATIARRRLLRTGDACREHSHAGEPLRLHRLDVPAFKPFDIGRLRDVQPLGEPRRARATIRIGRARSTLRPPAATAVESRRGIQHVAQRAAGSQPLSGRRNRRRHRGDRSARAARANSVRADPREGAWAARSNRRSCWCPSRST